MAGGYLCVTCKETFTSDHAFRMHRTGEYGKALYQGSRLLGYAPHTRRCMSQEEMSAAGMVKHPGSGRWSTGLFPVGGFPIKGDAQETVEIP